VRQAVALEEGGCDHLCMACLLAASFMEKEENTAFHMQEEEAMHAIVSAM